MIKTPQHFKREEIKSTITKILGQTKTNFEPLSISVSESLNDDFTTTDFSFEETGRHTEIVSVLDSKGKGFVDGLFEGLHHHFVEDFPSLLNVRLLDINVNPVMSKSRRRMATDAQASVAFVVEIPSHGPAEFQHSSRSIIHSGFRAALDAFQFYINCERTFHKIQVGLSDAAERNRSDIVQQCKYDLSKLTEVNSYVRKEKN